MEVRFWGTRGSIAAPGPDTVRYGGNTTCVELLFDGGQRAILDAGSGIRSLGKVLSQGHRPVECYLLVTHIHWDHIMGFPFFAPIYSEGARIRIDGCKRAMEGLRMTLNKGMVDGVFPVEFDCLSNRIEPLSRLSQGPLEIGSALVEGIELRHPQGGMGFRVREGESTLVFLTDNELSPHPVNGRSRADYVSFCQGADLLIHDAQYLPLEMEAKKGWGHSDCVSAVELALQAGVARLLLTHHDPDRTDQEVEDLVGLARAYAREKGSGLWVEGAREGQSLSI